MSLGRTAVRGSLMMIGGQGVRFVVQMVGLAVLARLLEPRDFGLVAMVTVGVGVADIVRDFGLSSAAVQAPTLSSAERSNLFWANTGLGAAASALVMAATPLFVALYDEPRLGQVVPPLSVVLLISGLNTQYRADLGRSLRFGSLALADVLAQVVGTLVAVVVAVAGGSYWAIVAQQLVAALVALVVNVVATRRAPGWWQRGVSIRRFFRFGTAVFATQLLGYAAKNADTAALGALRGSSTLGVYNRAQQIAVLPLNQINGPLTRVALPVLSQAYDGDPGRFASAVGRVQVAGAYLTGAVLGLVAGLAVPIVSVLLGPGWEAAGPILLVLAAGSVFRALSQLAYWVFLSSGHPGTQLRLDVVAQPLIVAGVAFGATQGAMGAALATLVVWPVYWVAGLALACRAAGIESRPLFARALRALVGVVLPLGGVAWVVQHLTGGGLVGLVAGGLAAVLTVTVVALLVGPVRRDVLAVGALTASALPRSLSRRIPRPVPEPVETPSSPR